MSRTYSPDEKKARNDARLLRCAEDEKRRKLDAIRAEEEANKQYYEKGVILNEHILVSKDKVKVFVSSGTKRDHWEWERQQSVDLCQEVFGPVAGELKRQPTQTYMYISLLVGELYVQIDQCWYKTCREHHITIAYLAGGDCMKMSWIREHLQEVVYKWKMHIGYSASRARGIMPMKYVVARDPHGEDIAESSILGLHSFTKEHEGQHIMMKRPLIGRTDDPRGREVEYRKAMKWLQSYEETEAQCRDPVVRGEVDHLAFIDASLEDDCHLCRQAQILTLCRYLTGCLMRNACLHWGKEEDNGLIPKEGLHITPQVDGRMENMLEMTKVLDESVVNSLVEAELALFHSDERELAGDMEHGEAQ